jgi:hypothetical protein
MTHGWKRLHAMLEGAALAMGRLRDARFWPLNRRGAATKSPKADANIRVAMAPSLNQAERLLFR